MLAHAPEVPVAVAVPAPEVLAPAPSGGPLVVQMRCWTSQRSGAPCTRHEVVVHPDWSVTTPHDLAAERLAVAFGGFLSCLELEGRTIPAAQRWLERQLRVVPDLVQFSGPPGRWHARQRQACCPSNGYDSATKAGEHVRDPRHVAAEFGCPRRQLTDLVKALGRAYSTSGAFGLDGPDAAAAARVCARGATDVTDLWYAGVHPRRVVQIHGELGVPGRLPARFFLGVLTRGTDLTWLGRTLSSSGVEACAEDQVQEAAGVPLDAPADESVTSWLAWTCADWDQRDPSARGRWLALGVSRPMILRLADAGYDPDEVAELAQGLGRDPDGAARQVAGWLDLGMRPAVADLVRLHRTGLGPHWYVPSGRAVKRLQAALGKGQGQASATELAFVLALAGTVPHAVVALRSGATLW
jgi:hypothetical protein